MDPSREKKKDSVYYVPAISSSNLKFSFYRNAELGHMTSRMFNEFCSDERETCSPLETFPLDTRTFPIDVEF